MPVSFKTRIEGTRLSAGIAKLAERAGDWRGAWPRLTGHLADALARQFESLGASGGGERWAPLSAAYARRKEQIYPGQPLLQASGRLFQSLTGSTGDTLRETEALKLRFGTRVAYASLLHSGTRRGLPARPLLNLTAGDTEAVASAMLRQAKGIAREAGFGNDER